MKEAVSCQHSAISLKEASIKIAFFKADR